MEMSLLTLNLHGWLEENQMDKFEKIAEFIYFSLNNGDKTS